MTVETTFEARIIPHTETHWEITSAHFEDGHLHIEFKDGTSGAIPISRFPAIAHATPADFEDLQVSPCGLLIENEHIEWDYAEAGLYQLVTESSHQSQ